MDDSTILKQSKKYEKPMVAFLRDIVAIPSESGRERRVVQRIKREMTKLRCFDRVWTDPMGNLLARVGRGPRLIAIDAHVDTVGIGDPAEWKHDRICLSRLGRMDGRNHQAGDPPCAMVHFAARICVGVKA